MTPPDRPDKSSKSPKASAAPEESRADAHPAPAPNPPSSRHYIHPARLAHFGVDPVRMRGAVVPGDDTWKPVPEGPTAPENP